MSLIFFIKPLFCVLKFQCSSCHGQSPLKALIPTNEPTHVDKNTTRDLRLPREVIIPQTSPLSWESLPALKTVRWFRNCLHSPLFAPVILQNIKLSQVFLNFTGINLTARPGRPLFFPLFWLCYVCQGWGLAISIVASHPKVKEPNTSESFINLNLHMLKHHQEKTTLEISFACHIF